MSWFSVTQVRPSRQNLPPVTVQGLIQSRVQPPAQPRVQPRVQPAQPRVQPAQPRVQSAQPRAQEHWAWGAGQTKKQWGPRAWKWLHLMTISYPQEPTEKDAQIAEARIQNFVANLPCPECRQHASEYLKENPPDFSSSSALQAWAWRFHNAVNARLGHQTFSFAAYSRLYLSEMCWANWSAAECSQLGHLDM